MIQAAFSSIKFGDKAAFVINYPASLIQAILSRRPEKTVRFIDGTEFSYYGDHQNLLLDHLITHMKYYYRHYESPKIVFDVGASFGTFSLIVNYFYPEAQIHAFEMNGRCAEDLRRNCGNKRNITVNNVAIGKSAGLISYSSSDNYPEGSRVVAAKTKKAKRIPQIRLLDYIKRSGIGRIDLIKIDTEGHELKVLQGLGDKIRICRKVIIETEFEMNNLIAILKFMNQANFRLIATGDVNWDHQKNHIGSMDLIFLNGGLR